MRTSFQWFKRGGLRLYGAQKWEKLLLEKTKLVTLGTKKTPVKWLRSRCLRVGLNVRSWDPFHPVSCEIVGNEGFKISASIRILDRL